MAKTEDSAARFLPDDPSLPALRAAAAGCTACNLYKTGTRTVFGAGPPQALLMMVGEQPGDAEGLAGEPFVGPAGKLLDKALAEVGIDRQAVFVTNAVKHFKWEPRGKRRIHAKPSAREVKACHPWLQAEIAAVRPKVIVCLGATAAQALLGASFRVTQERGRFVHSALAPYVMATVHPSALLRLPEADQRHAELARFVEDLRKVAGLLQEVSLRHTAEKIGPLNRAAQVQGGNAVSVEVNARRRNGWCCLAIKAVFRHCWQAGKLNCADLSH